MNQGKIKTITNDEDDNKASSSGIGRTWESRFDCSYSLLLQERMTANHATVRK